MVTASPNDEAPFAPTTCTVTVLASGTLEIGPAGEGMTLKSVTMDREVSPLQSTMTIVPGSTLWASTARRVSGRNRRSSSAVITAAASAETSCRWEYGRAASDAAMAC